ncbi:MAG TPA: transporter substrate-binding domain-containing protein, partial [Acidimicrobiales bacterium]|nr:transporter substrate-binding domain-containing protein [Acidimicrobiales bacterium]
MKKQRWLIASLLALSLLAAACGGGDDDDVATDTTAGGDTPTTQAALEAPTFPAGSTMETLQKKAKIVVGTKFDQPGFGQKNPTSGEVEGFDVEIAKLIAVGIYGGRAEDMASKIEFKEAVSKTREGLITAGEVDFIVATYTINDARKQVIDFAGPYFVAQQDIMTKADDSTINGVADLDGKKVCTVKGSTSEKNVVAKAPKAQVTLFDTYSQCAEALT